MTRPKGVREAGPRVKPSTQCQCGLPNKGHPRCETCLIYVGPGHTFESTKYRGYGLCTACGRDWGKHPNWSFEEFKSPILTEKRHQRLERRANAVFLSTMGRTLGQIASALRVTKHTISRDLREAASLPERQS